MAQPLKFKITSPYGVVGRYSTLNKTAVLAGDGDAPIQLTKSGSLIVSVESWAVTGTTSLTGSIQAAVGSGYLRSITGRIDTALPTQNFFLQVWDTATAIASGSQTSTLASGSVGAPLKIVHTTGTDNFISRDFHEGGVAFTNGCFVAVSQQEFVYGPCTGSIASLEVEYATVR